MKSLKLEELQVGELYVVKWSDSLYQVRTLKFTQGGVSADYYRSFGKYSSEWGSVMTAGHFPFISCSFHSIPKAQPDTSTLEGKIEVMEASKIVRVQFQRKDFHAKWEEATSPDDFSWDWWDYNYRIHPDDLYDSALASLTPAKKEPSWDDKTFNAWFESIQHWTRLSNGTSEEKESIFDDHCALCKVFRISHSNCTTCPVKQKTGQNICAGSPWHKVFTAYGSQGKESSQFKLAAKEELAFLLSLLPEDMKERYEREKTKQDIPLKKKEPSYRNWQPEEVPVGAAIRYKQTNQGPWLIMGPGRTIGSVKISEPNTVLGGWQEFTSTGSEVSYDHGKTWLPCGILIE